MDRRAQTTVWHDKESQSDSLIRRACPTKITDALFFLSMFCVSIIVSRPENQPPQHSTDPEKPITSGFYRQEAGEPLVYTYTYHEMKIIVGGEFYISDAVGTSVHAVPGDVFYFPKGSVITFDSPSYGLGFFCGQRPTGDA